MRTSITTALAALATASLLGPVSLLAASPASAAVEETRIRPAALEQSTAPAVPIVDRRNLIHGELRLRVPGRAPYLLGQSGTAYVVASQTADGGSRILRLEQDGSHRVLVPDATDAPLLSADGSRLVEFRYRGDRTRHVVRDTTSGAVVASKRWRGYQGVVGADADRVVVADDERTRVWYPEEGRTTRLTDGRAYRADFATDRLARFTGDPYQGGCTLVSTISRPEDVIWKSCGEAVVSFSPTGRMATVHKLSDGIGPNEVKVRSASGSLRARYTIDGYFGWITWESGRSIILDSAGWKRAAYVRCDGAVCERVTPLRATNLS